MGIATFNLTIAYLTFSQLLSCISKYVKLVPFIIFFLALFKFLFKIFSKSLFPLLYSFAFSLSLSLYSLLLSFLFSFVLSYQSFSPRLIFYSFKGLYFFYNYWSSSCHTAIYTFFILYMKTVRFKRFCLPMTRVIRNQS